MQCEIRTGKKSRKRRIIFALLIVFAILALIITHMIVNVYPIVKVISCEELTNTTTEVINDSLRAVMGERGADADELVTITRDQNNNITSLSVDTISVNNWARDTTLVAQSKLKAIGEIKLEIPVGTLSGITFLGGVGPPIVVRMTPVGAVNTRFRSVFKSAGINNTLYSIMMITQVTVNMVIPGMSNTITLEVEVPMIDTIIVGSIPDTYLNSNSLDEMLNLIP